MSNGGLRVLPTETIYFQGPYTRPCYGFIYLLNYTDRPIAFKLKTTSPRRFNVRPVKSIVPPNGGVITATLLLNPLMTLEGYVTEGGPFDQQKQKFMIEWSYVPEDSESESEVSVILQQARSRGEVNQYRLQCKFDAEQLASVLQQRQIIAETVEPTASISQFGTPGLTSEIVDEDEFSVTSLLMNPMVAIFITVLAIAVIVQVWRHVFQHF